MSDEQAKPTTEENEKEASTRLRSFEVGIGHICNGLGVDYDDFAKQANARFKFAEKEADAPSKLAPWLIDQIVAEVTKAEAAQA
jgi:hypothetical protein